MLESLEAGPLASLIERWRPRLKGEDQVLVLPPRARAQGPRARVRRGRARGHRAHGRRDGRGPMRRGDRGRARRRGLRRDRPVPAEVATGRRPCAYHPRREVDPAARPRGPSQRRLPAAVRDPADHAVGRRTVPGGARLLDRVQPRGAEHDPRLRHRDAGGVPALLDPRPVHRGVHRPLVAPEDPRRRAVAASRGRVAGAVRPEDGAGAVLRRRALGALGEPLLPRDGRRRWSRAWSRPRTC